MITYYTNRELSKKLKINLAKWKRWSREFLPPDPLGGLQSGYARQYTRDDAFTVYLGGSIVSDLKFTIPEAKTILNDLKNWLTQAGFYTQSNIRDTPAESIHDRITHYQVSVQPVDHQTVQLRYRIRGILSDEAVSIGGYPARQVRYIETVLPEEAPPQETEAATMSKMLNITRVADRFAKALTAAS